MSCLTFSNLLIAEEPADYPQLLELLEDARKNNDHEALADIYYRLACYEEEELGEKPKSFEHFTRSAEYYKLIGDTDNYNKVQWRIANHLSNEQNYEVSIPIYQELADYYQESNDIPKLNSVYIDLSKIYANQFETDLQNEVLEKILKINEDLNDTLVTIEVYLQQIEQHYNERRIDLALETAFNAFNLSNEMGSRPLIAKSLYHVGYANLLLDDTEKALKYLGKSLEYESFQPNDKHRLKVLNNLSSAYAIAGDFENAFVYSQMSSKLNDSILNLDRTYAINNLTTKYETRKKKSRGKAFGEGERICSK